MGGNMEGYKPSAAEIQQAEATMRPEQQILTRERQYETKLAEASVELREMGEAGWWDRTVGLVNEIASLAAGAQKEIIPQINERYERFDSRTGRHEIDFKDKNRDEEFEDLRRTSVDGYRPAESGAEALEEFHRLGLGEGGSRPFTDLVIETGESWHIIGAKVPAKSWHGADWSKEHKRMTYQVSGIVRRFIEPMLSEESVHTIELLRLKHDLERKVYSVREAEAIVKRMEDKIRQEKESISKNADLLGRIGIDPKDPRVF